MILNYFFVSFLFHFGLSTIIQQTNRISDSWMVNKFASLYSKHGKVIRVMKMILIGNNYPQYVPVQKHRVFQRPQESLRSNWIFVVIDFFLLFKSKCDEFGLNLSFFSVLIDLSVSRESKCLSVCCHIGVCSLFQFEIIIS